MSDCQCFDEMYNYLFAAAFITGCSLFMNLGQYTYFRLYVRENGDTDTTLSHTAVVHSHEEGVVEEKDYNI